MEQESSREIAKELAKRAEEASPERDPAGMVQIGAAEYRRLFIKGLAALLREVDAISYALRQRER